jgi:gamma-glutamyl-gamma-aminobutyrate hydrolase PuuD
MKVFHAMGWEEYSNWIPDRVIVKDLAKADLVVFEGGTDVNPALYGDKLGKYTQEPDIRRDKRETAMFVEAVKRGIPMLGVCRGSQLLCVLSGGSLIQHQSHPYMHLATTSEGNDIIINSTHHQTQYPFDLKEFEEYHLLAWADGLSDFHLDGSNKEIKGETKKEVEIAYYPKVRALAIQCHPESMSKHNHAASFDYFDMLFNKLMNNKF